VKGAIATVDFFASNTQGTSNRLSLVIDAPKRSAAGDGWQCRVALADLHPPRTLIARDSVEALSLALAQARTWISELHDQGRVLTRDRGGQDRFDLS
jgi:hypothetical protein